MAALDAFQYTQPNLTGPATNAFAVAPHDTNELSYVTRGLFVGGAGNVVVVMMSNEEVTFTGVAAGTLLPIRVKKVKSTGTTATNIVGVY